jgi:2-dehydro-3-deoxyphosphooctonate aldolase (KDO 8-P synthase)
MAIKLHNITVGRDPNTNTDGPLFIIAGPCVLEDDTVPLVIGRRMKELCQQAGLPYIFKASYDKANRTSSKSFRGPGIEAGLAQLAAIRDELNVPVLTDVHTAEECTLAGKTVDVLQIPAFLCRQTDMLKAAAETGKCVNIKKGQFLSPWEMKQVADKMREFGCKDFMLTERGTTFGYNNLVADMRSFPIMRENGVPVVIDATHSVQRPGGMGDKSGGDGIYAPVIARAAVAAVAKSDGPNMIPLDQMPALLPVLRDIHDLVRKAGLV